MRVLEAVIVGREAELAAVEGLLDGVADGPAVLVLTGEAGIGKTSVWRVGVEAARVRGFTVWASRPAAAEVRLSYAGLSDLLADVSEEHMSRLPDPQRRALDAAMLRGPVHEEAPDPRAVAAGFLTLLGQLTHAGSVLVAIDDWQWLDDPTRRVVTFAIRRCRGRATFLLARRDEDPTPGGASAEAPGR